MKTIAPVLASTPDLADVTENMPPGCDYLLLDKSYTILETSLKNDDVKSALRYATDGVNTANNGKQFLLITRDKELIVLQYYIGSRFINPWLNKYFSFTGNDTLLSNCSELRVCMYTINHSFFKASTKTISAYYERDRRNFITKS
ncbi:MAG: hypothetical protein ACLTQN_02010 [Blautia massiliensis (ex Durand et al. 2017)]